MISPKLNPILFIQGKNVSHLNHITQKVVGLGKSTKRKIERVQRDWYRGRYGESREQWSPRLIQRNNLHVTMWC